MSLALTLALNSYSATYEWEGGPSGQFSDPTAWFNVTANVQHTGPPGPGDIAEDDTGGSITFQSGGVQQLIGTSSSTFDFEGPFKTGTLIAGGVNITGPGQLTAGPVTASGPASSFYVQGGHLTADSVFNTSPWVSAGGSLVVHSLMIGPFNFGCSDVGSTIEAQVGITNASISVQAGGNLTALSIQNGAVDDSVFLDGQGTQVSVTRDFTVTGGFLDITDGAGLDVGSNLILDGIPPQGAGGHWGDPQTSIHVSGVFTVGNSNGSFFLNINNGARLRSNDSRIDGPQQSSVDLNSTGTVWEVSTTGLAIGDTGKGLLNVHQGASLVLDANALLAVGVSSGSSGTLQVADPGTVVDALNGPLAVGVAGSGLVSVNDGAELVTGGESSIGQETNGVGLAEVWGLARNGTSTVLTEWLADGGVTVGDSGSATLNLQYGGSLVLPSGADLTVGSELSATGAVFVIGTPLPGTQTLLDARASSVTIGDSGHGGLTGSNGGQMWSGDADIGSEIRGAGAVMLRDSGTAWRVVHDLTVGTKGSGTLLAQNQATLSVGNNLVAGDEASANGKVTFTGPGTAVSVNGELTDGGAGSGTTLVQLGATLTTDSATLAEEANSTGKLTVSGGNALFATRTDLTIGAAGVGGLTVTGPGTVHTGKDATVAEARNSLSTVSLSAGGAWIVDGDLTAGSQGIAGVSVTTGGQLFALGSITLAEQTGSGGTVSFDSRDTNGIPATLTYAGDLVIGEAGDAKFTLTNDAVALIATNGSGLVSLAPSPTATAKLTIAGTNSLLQANILKVAVGEGEPGGQGTNMLLNGGQVSVAQQVETGEGGVIDVRGGSFTVGATNPVATFGTLKLNPGGLLAGCGQIKGKVINAGGEVAPGCSPGTLTVEGDYTQTASGSLNLRITGSVGRGGSNDVLSVTGNVALAGQVTLNFINGFAPRQGQSFTFLQFGGSLTGAFGQVVVTGLAPGFQCQLSQTPAGTFSLTALNNGVATSSPLLSLTSAAGQLRLSWPDTATGYELETNANLGNPAGWQPFQGTITDSNGQQNATVSSASGLLFFRLRHP